MFKLFNNSSSQQQVNYALSRLEKVILESLDFKTVVQKVVDSMLYELGYLKLGYRIIVLGLINEPKQVMERISISQTEEAVKAVSGLPFPFSQADIPLSAKENYCVKVTEIKSPLVTHYWPDILSPPLTEQEAVMLQKQVGIKTSMVYPLIVQNKSIGMMIFSMVKHEKDVSNQEKDLLLRFTDIVGLAVQNSKLYTALDQKTELLKQTNDQLQIANNKLQELDKLKDEFVSLASHELRTPMTAIKGSLSTILDGYTGEVNTPTKEFLTAAFNENDRLIRLVNNLLNISRIEAGRITFTITKIDLDKLIKEVVKNLQMSATEKNLTLMYKDDNLPSIIMGDEDKVKEILINLIGNALKFTHQGGVTVSVFEKDNMITTAVSDTGHGIAKEDQDLLFKKFSQVKGSYAKQSGGTGLGLYISKKMIEGMKGNIWLESEVGKGSTFYFSLPKAL